MATFAQKTLAIELMPNTQTDVYAPGSGITALIHNITLHNDNTTTETVTLWKYVGGTAYKIFKVSLVADETLIIQWENEGMVVANPSKIQGSTTMASKVTCDINGSEVS